MDIYKLNFTVLEQEIFSYLCLRAGGKLSQREIAKKLRVSPTAVSNSIKSLKKQNLIAVEKTKTINFISFNSGDKKATAMKRVENLKNIYLSGLADFFQEELPGATVIVFGSYSKGEDIHTSDIDIAVIERKEKLLELTGYEKVLDRKINVNFYRSWSDINKHLRNNILNGILLQGSVNL